MVGRKSIFHDPSQVERLKKILLESPTLTLKQIGQAFNRDSSVIRKALVDNSLTRKDIRGFIQKTYSNEKPIPHSYKDYALKAGYEVKSNAFGVYLKRLKGDKLGRC